MHPHLPDHLVWSVTLPQAERTGEIADEEWLLLDGSQESLIDGLLVCGTGAGWLLLLYIALISHIFPKKEPPLMLSYLWLLALSEECFLTLLLLTSFPSKVGWLRNLVNLLLVNARDVDLVGCRNDVAGVDSSERNAVNLEWAGNEKDTLGKVLQEDDTLAAEATSEEDEDGARSERWARSVWADGFADLNIYVSSPYLS